MEDIYKNVEMNRMWVNQIKHSTNGQKGMCTRRDRAITGYLVPNTKQCVMFIRRRDAMCFANEHELKMRHTHTHKFTWNRVLSNSYDAMEKKKLK